jgi:DNA-binding response OmpR family regulator
MMQERILVVDDETDTRETIAMFLSHMGFEVQTAPNGQRALALLDDKPFDLMVLDIMMPGLSGFDVLERVRANEKLVGLPIIMVTALDSTEDIVKAFELGASDYITKPFVNAELIARTSTAMRHRRLEKEKSTGLELQDFKKALIRIAHEMNQPMIHLTRCCKHLFKEAKETPEELVQLRRKLYDDCIRVQLILKELEKIKSLEV